MSIEIIKRKISDFLNTNTPEVMAINGKWGVGKTFSWNKFLLEAQSLNNISCKRYSYVSLFGINSLEAFKYAIFENSIKRELIGSEVSIETLRENTSSLTESLGRQVIGLLKGTGLASGFTSAIDSAAFLSINNTLICIDDLERKGSGLDIKDVLGLVSLLKEQKKCKVVILLNDGEEGLEDYKKYREKVVDLELKFAPSPKECAAIAFDGESNELTTLRDLTEKLNIHNIRILKKIERLVNMAKPYLTEYEDQVKYQVTHSLTLYAWSHYCSETNEDIPDLAFLSNIGYTTFGFGSRDNEELDEKQKKWKTLLQHYEYMTTDELDLVIANAVTTGYFVEEDLKREASKKNEEVKISLSENSFSKAWELYHGSFENDQDHVISTLYASLKENVKNVSITNLNGTVALFRDLGEEEKASELIDYYIEKRRNETALFNLKENNFFGDKRDDEIVSKFDDVFKETAATESAKEILERISGKNGWNQIDEVTLANTPSEEYYQIFNAVSGKTLTRYVTKCLEFGQYRGANDDQVNIAKNAIEALKIIALESDINKRRVQKFGIEIA
jgi:hypothetical protein